MGLDIPVRFYPETMVTGRVYGSQAHIANATKTPTVGQCWFSPLVVPNAIQVAKIGCEVTAIGTAATFRFGIFADSSGVPGTLIGGTDLGSINAPGAPGVLESTLTNLFLGPGLYWLAQVQPAATAAATVRALNAGTNNSEYVRGAAGTDVTQGLCQALLATTGAGALSSSPTITGCSNNAPATYIILA